ncbi:MAG: hypothetical protein QOI29_2901 [Mycobacterium sp.]|nr:hypothetical protein [Mycobacterium sp.]
MTILEDRRVAADDLPPVVAPPSTNGKRPPPIPAPPDSGAESAVGEDQAAQQLRLVRTARRTSVAITVLIAIASFVLSFASLSELAATTAFPGRIWFLHLAWLWPVIVDGLIILATVGIVALSPYPDQRANRNYYWGVLVAFALVSVLGNGWHAWLVTEHLTTWMRYGAVALASSVPVALLVATHSMAIQWRFNPTMPPDEASHAQAGALAIAAERAGKWDAVAAAIHEQGLVTSQPSATIAQVLRYLYDQRPKMSLRQIGAQPTVQLHHDTVGKIRDAAKAVLGPASGGDP